MDKSKVSAHDQDVQVKVLQAAQVINPDIGIEEAIGWTAKSANQMLKNLPIKTLTCQLLKKQEKPTSNGHTKCIFFLKTWYENGDSRTFNAVAWDLPVAAYDDIAKFDFINVTGAFRLETWQSKQDGEMKAFVNFIVDQIQSIETPQRHRRRGKCTYIARAENRYENNPSSAQFRSEAESVGLSDEGEPAAPLGQQ